LNELVAGGGGELSPYQPSQRYFLLDEARLADGEPSEVAGAQPLSVPGGVAHLAGGRHVEPEQRVEEEPTVVQLAGVHEKSLVTDDDHSPGAVLARRHEQRGERRVLVPGGNGGPGSGERVQPVSMRRR